MTFPRGTNTLWLSLLAVLLLGGCAIRPALVSGRHEGEVVWRGEVRIAGDVELAPGSLLTILPGTRVLFLPPPPGTDLLTEHPHFPGSELIVRGRLVAEGTREAPIVFAFADAAGGPGSWGGINLVESPEASFRFCVFRQADSAVHSQASRVEIEESVFERNLVGIRFHSSEMLIEHNLLRDNGTGIRFHYGAPVICGNELRDNDRAFFITSFPSGYRIQGNNIVGSREASVVLGEEVPQDVLMPHNWWGSRRAAEIEAGFFDGRRVDYLGRVEYRPAADAPCREAGIAWSP
jgi:hypothetical protein